MLVGFGLDMVQVVYDHEKGYYKCRRIRPYQSKGKGGFKTFDEALNYAKSIPKENPDAIQERSAT